MSENHLRGLLAQQPPNELNALGGMLSPATANPNMLAQAMRARQQPRNMLVGPTNATETAQYAGMVPGLGLLGVGGDISQYIQQPETRGLLNYGLTALGALPGLGIAKQAIFAGLLAKTADIPKKQLAEVMEKAGRSREDIWKETGWFKGPEGKWKFEIDDSAAKFNNGMPTWGRLHENAPIDKTFKHDNLYAAYPDSANLTLSPLSPDSRNIAGSFDGELGSIFIEAQLNKKHQNNIASTTLHELQHAIQKIEGFQGGGSPSAMATEYAKAYQNYDFDTTLSSLARTAVSDFGGNVDAAAKELTKVGIPVTDDHIRELMRIGESAAIKRGDDAEKMFKSYGRQNRGDVGYDLYNRLAGEAEARAVQSRMNMAPAQRQATPPWQSYDVPWEQLIIK